MKIGESKEDYLEAAYVLKRQKGYVRNSMLSDYLNYSKASVSVAVRGLLADGYVIKDRYGSIELTEEGRKIAKKIYARHVLLEEFLRRIGVSSETEFLELIGYLQKLQIMMHAGWNIQSAKNLIKRFKNWYGR